MPSPYCLNFAWNNLSFGSVSFALTRELFKRGELPPCFPIFGQAPDVSAQVPDVEFNQKLGACVNNANQGWSRKGKALTLWHIQGSLSSFAERGNHLITFFELDSLTTTEVNILKQQAKVYVTSTFSQKVFADYGIDSTYLPIGFDSHNFKVLEKRPSIDGVTQFFLGGKAEKRKASYQVLRAWAKRYGNNAAYRLNCAIHNPFLPADRASALINEALQGQHYWNIQFLPWVPDNATYNVTLQSSQIAICMSGGEGRDLPCYHATALGAWPVAMRAHAFTDYLNDSNAVLVSPNGKIPAADGVHFASGGPFNSGNIYSFSDEAFIAGCEEAERRVKDVGLNVKGLELQKLGYSQAADILLADLKA